MLAPGYVCGEVCGRPSDVAGLVGGKVGLVTVLTVLAPSSDPDFCWFASTFSCISSLVAKFSPPWLTSGLVSPPQKTAAVARFVGSLPSHWTSLSV